MRVVLDTNVLISALIVPGGPSDYLYQSWSAGRFELITSKEQLDEFRHVTRYPRLRKYLRPAAAGTMLNEIRVLAVVTGPLPKLRVCADPADNFLLAMVQEGNADYLVTGDARHLLALKRYRTTRIVTVRALAKALGYVAESH